MPWWGWHRVLACLGTVKEPGWHLGQSVPCPWCCHLPGPAAKLVPQGLCHTRGTHDPGTPALFVAPLPLPVCRTCPASNPARVNPGSSRRMGSSTGT